VTATTGLTLAVCSAPGGGSYEARVIAPGSHAQITRGKGSNTRYVTDILPEGDPAHALLVVEVITPAGNTSSYPPHKHDTDDLPRESLLEETYYHRLKPPQGFALQRVYTDDRSLDEAMAVEDGDVTLVPRGYHPVATVHGYDLYYLNVMAGPTRTWKFHNAPEHEWLLKKGEPYPSTSLTFTTRPSLADFTAASARASAIRPSWPLGAAGRLPPRASMKAAISLA